MQRSEQEVQQLWGGGVGDIAAQTGQQAESVLDFLKHVGVLGLVGQLGPQCQEALCV